MLSGNKEKSRVRPVYSHLSSDEKPISMVHATDLHYLSSDLTDMGSYFTKMVEDADGKNMVYIEEITETFVEKMLEDKPELLILSGDITFNGEKQSHIDLEKKLSRIQKNGTQILLIPGNHDIDRSSAAKFTQDTYKFVDTVSKESFADMYKEYGLQQALHKDDKSLSYVYAARSDFWLLMLDSNSQRENSLADETLEWVDQVLKEAKEKDVQVLAVSHQNIANHHSDFHNGFLVNQSGKLVQLYQKYEVLLNLSGHIHIQHVADAQVPEIITSALPISPHQYGEMRYDGRQLDYQTKEITVEKWAEKHGKTDKVLLDFSKESRTFMERVAAKKVEDDLSRLPLTKEEKELMQETFAAINADYFAGNLIVRENYQQGLELWEKHETSFSTSYLKTVLESGERSQKKFVKIIEKK